MNIQILALLMLASSLFAESEWLMRGNESYRNEDYSSAITSYQKAIELNKNDTTAHKFLISSYYELGKQYSDKGGHDTAIEYFLKASAMNPLNSAIYCEIGLTYSKKENFDKATKYWKKAIAINPKDIDTYITIAEMCDMISIPSSNGEKYSKKAIEYFNKVIELDPENANAHFKIGRIFLLNGNRKMYSKYLKKAAQLGSFEAQDFCGLNGISW